MEIPLKVKHARATIIGTFRYQGAHQFWSIVLRQPVMVLKNFVVSIRNTTQKYKIYVNNFNLYNTTRRKIEYQLGSFVIYCIKFCVKVIHYAANNQPEIVGGLMKWANYGVI